MNNIEHLWDSGAASPYNMNVDAIDAFKKATKSVCVVGLRWRHAGAVHEIKSYAYVLPDLTGVVTTSEWSGEGANWLDLINADGTLRFRMHPPYLSDKLDHTDARLEGLRPGWTSSGIPLGIQAGYRVNRPEGQHDGLVSVGVLLDIDWETGQLKNWLMLPPWF